MHGPLFSDARRIGVSVPPRVTQAAVQLFGNCAKHIIHALEALRISVQKKPIEQGQMLDCAAPSRGGVGGSTGDTEFVAADHTVVPGTLRSHASPNKALGGRRIVDQQRHAAA
jgi:hypothetical protein